jgi:hypothetical protein
MSSEAWWHGIVRKAEDALDRYAADPDVSLTKGERISFKLGYWQALTAAPSPDRAESMGLPSREEIARVIDPAAWEERDDYLRRADKWEAKGRPAVDVLTSRYREKADTIVAPSLAKADALFVLLEGGRADG